MSDYPRWMFHRNHDMVLVDSEEQEAALGAGWSRVIQPRETEPAPSLPEEPEPAPEMEPPRKVRKRG